MAKAKKNRSKVEKLARQAGKVAARAERAARDAVNKVSETSTYVVDLVGHPGQAVNAIGSAVTTGGEKLGELGSSATRLLGVGGSHAGDTADADALEAAVRRLGLPTRADFQALTARVAALEGRGTAKRRATKPKSAAAPANKPAAKKAPAKAAAKPAASRTRKSPSS